MITGIKNHTFKFGLFLLGLTGSLSAQQACCSSNNECNASDCCADEWFNLERFTFGAEGLVWKAVEDDLSYANKINDIIDVPAPGTFNDINHEKVCPKFKWDTGFRLNLEYCIPCTCGLDFDLTWTNFRNHTGNSSHSANIVPDKSIGLETPDVRLFSTFAPGTGNNFRLNKIDAHWHLKFNDVIWALGGSIDCGCDFFVKPYIGLKYTAIDQSYRFHYQSEETHLGNGSVASPAIRAKQKIKTEYNGVGLQGGFETQWFLGCGFGIYSNIDAGITRGRVRIHDTYFETDITDGTTSLIKQKDTNHVTRPNIDLGIGINWQHCLCDSYWINLKTGWEYHRYFQQNFFRYASDDFPNKGSLTLYGWTFGADIQF